ncbi:MAG: DUF3410 domain-containing protein, partial [Prevotellaceae bacterium]|nr:DUF3410 domain-containing protein [Prevotellaceae bacterium]
AINHFFCLGLDNFSVKNLSAKKTVYSKGSELLKTLLNNYDIKFDSNNLKKNPQNFEDLRNNYRERREIEILSNL